MSLIYCRSGWGQYPPARRHRSRPTIRRSPMGLPLSWRAANPYRLELVLNPQAVDANQHNIRQDASKNGVPRFTLRIGLGRLVIL